MDQKERQLLRHSQKTLARLRVVFPPIYKLGCFRPDAVPTLQKGTRDVGVVSIATGKRVEWGRRRHTGGGNV